MILIVYVVEKLCSKEENVIMSKFIEIMYTDDTRTLLRKDSIIRVQEAQKSIAGVENGTWIIYNSGSNIFTEMHSATFFDEVRERLNE